jgi:hypothetical protein
MSSISQQVEKITPHRALELLNTSAGNRSIRRSMVLRFAEDMENGKWVVNGEPVIISNTGRLIEGHHRMHACIRAATAFETVTIYGIPDSAFPTLNTGGSRSPGDVFNIERVPNANKVTSLITKSLHYHHSIGKTTINQWNLPYNLTKQKLLEVYRTDPEGYDAATSRVGTLYNEIPQIVPSIAGGMHYLFTTVDTKMAEDFMQRFISGANMSETHPAMALRRAWAKRGTYKRRSGAEEMMVITCHAWNAFRNGRDIRILRHNAEHPVPDYR